MKLVAALTAAALLATAGVASAAPSGRRQAVQEILDEVTTDGGALGVQARITGLGTFRSGVAELGSRKPVPHNGTFRIGSNTKPFVSTVALQLVGEGKIALDEPVTRYLTGLVDSRITVRQLLQHTSGLFDYTEALPLDPEGFPSIRYKTWDPLELVKIGTSRPLAFEPGAQHSYSNTNYIVIGLLIEKVTGRPYARAVEQRILKPLHLNDTVLPGADLDVPGPHAHGYYPDASGKPVDVTRLNPSWGGAAGEMISTTRDLDTFLNALLAGKLLKPLQQKELLKTTAASPDYGLGVSVLQLSCKTLYGHDGLIHGYSTMMIGTQDKRVMLSITHAANGRAPGGIGIKLLETVYCR
ncbi:serine hydrolase domain-containing protein [Lentzea sp. NPDC051838]|uniref:serine hydrolase domain-containing protein n=1 Tax=Lentzea sp. NPDC051838 TaxID=3154849 RepID=UPI0034177272